MVCTYLRFKGFWLGHVGFLGLTRGENLKTSDPWKEMMTLLLHLRWKGHLFASARDNHGSFLVMPRCVLAIGLQPSPLDRRDQRSFHALGCIVTGARTRRRCQTWKETLAGYDIAVELQALHPKSPSGILRGVDEQTMKTMLL